MKAGKCRHRSCEPAILLSHSDVRVPRFTRVDSSIPEQAPLKRQVVGGTPTRPTNFIFNAAVDQQQMISPTRRRLLGQHQPAAPFRKALKAWRSMHSVGIGASPVKIRVRASPSHLESKPQQTGTRLLPGHGEVATTSGSSLRPRRRSRRVTARSISKCVGGPFSSSGYGSAGHSQSGQLSTGMNFPYVYTWRGWRIRIAFTSPSLTTCRKDCVSTTPAK